MDAISQPLCQSPGSATATLSASPGSEAESLEELAYRFGRCYDSYLAADADRECFRSRNGRGAVGFVRIGKYLHVGGGLLAPEADREQLLAELVQHADRRDLQLSFYNLTEHDLPLFRGYGFQATKLGEEALIDLPSRVWTGGEYAWIRRQTSYCRRQGLAANECTRETSSPHEWRRTMDELHEISSSFLAAKPQANEMRFLDGSFAPERLARQRIFIARSGDGAGRAEGFLLCNPFLNGRAWAFELYRRRVDAVRGVIPFLMHQAMERLRREGIEQVSLCLVPGLRAEQPIAGDSALARRALALGSRRFGAIFDVAGQHQFKSRFRPRFESRYLCARPGVTFGSAWALVRLLGVLDLDFGKLRRRLGERLQSSACRASSKFRD